MKPEPLPPLPGNLPSLAPTPEPARGVISWNMNTTCNYRCSYCTQRFLDDRGRWARDVPRFLEAFARLPGRWEIKLSGGEPFVHPDFLVVVRGLRELGFLISVVTNFSASQETLLGFLEAAGDQLGVMSCSLHLEYVDTEEALERFITHARFVKERLPRGASLCVTCVATETNLLRLSALKERMASAGLTFKVQPEKQGRDVVAYSEGQLAQLVQLGGHNLTGYVAPDFGGRPCWSGARYFILDDRGNAYRCYPARRYRTESLGNMLDGTFRLREAATPCLYRYCNCTVPISRGMMPTEGAQDAVRRARAEDDA
ncbi:MAG: radical SAM protein [Myxococcota bacterium]